MLFGIICVSCISILFPEAAAHSEASLRHASKDNLLAAKSSFGGHPWKEDRQNPPWTNDDGDVEGTDPLGTVRRKMEGEYTKEDDPRTFVPMKEHLEEIKSKEHYGHCLFAGLFLCLMVTTAGAFCMANSSNKIIVKCTWGTLDHVVGVVIGKTLFYIVNNLFHDLASDLGEHHCVAMHVAYSVTLFVGALFGSWALKSRPVYLKVFNGVTFWIIVLAQGGALGEAQKQLGESMLDKFKITMSFLVFMTILMIITNLLKPEPEWYDDVEIKLTAGAFAAGFVAFVYMLINNGSHDHEHGASWESDEQTVLTNSFAVAACAVAVFGTPFLHNKAKTTKSYWGGRFTTFLAGFIGHLPHFTVSVGAGLFVCNLLGVPPITVMAKLINAMVGGVVGCVVVFACAFIPYLNRDDDNTKSLVALLLGFGGFMIGSGWAGLLINSIDEVVEDFDSHSRKSEYKAGLILFINAVLLPTYIFFLEPIVIQKTS